MGFVGVISKYSKVSKTTLEVVKSLFHIAYEKHCIKKVRIRSYSGPFFPVFGLNTERYIVYLRIQSECGKIRTRITPNPDTFYGVNLNRVTFFVFGLSSWKNLYVRCMLDVCYLYFHVRWLSKIKKTCGQSSMIHESGHLKVRSKYTTSKI